MNDTPAFPCKGSIKGKQYVKIGNNKPELQDTYLPCDYQGMTLRDYFAGQALAGILAHPDCNRNNNPIVHEALAEMAYQNADAMLLEREKKGE